MDVKKLKTCTIVPDELYIRRTADEQIRNIIEDMERPGYVLVARQMGKTNLLLHTKKEMEDARNIFTYIDFQSVNANSAEECFEAMVNKIIKTHQNTFKEAADEIIALRKNGNPLLQGFTEELLILLRNVDKIVLILDEIDALSRYDYSDRIFSQIRSHYFERLSYPELKKLTYILSGVVEPKNIIKDPNISPFNIGQKIYMKDFSREEFNTFITKTGFDLLYKEDIINRIYYWTHGHPRMTWDVCQLLESASIKIEFDRDVDLIVKNAYLTTYDMVPVDSIRALVKDNLKLRDAVIALVLNKSNEIDSDLKSELYLAGIINHEENNVKFKNPILEKALPYEWLVSIDRDDEAYLSKIEKRIFIENNYGSSITQLTTILKNIKDKELRSHGLFLLGIAYFRALDNEKSLDTLQKIDFDAKDYEEAQLFIGHNYNNLKKEEEAIITYRNASEKTSDNMLKGKLQLGLVDTYLHSEITDNIDKAEQILNLMLKEFASQPQYCNILIAINYYLSSIAKYRGKTDEAISYIENSLLVSNGNERPYILYKKMELFEDETTRISVFDELTKSLLELREKPQSEDFDDPMGLNLFWLIEILSYYIAYRKEYLTKLEKCVHWISANKEDACWKVLSIISASDKQRGSDVGKSIVDLSSDEDWHFKDYQLVDAKFAMFENESDGEKKKDLAVAISDILLYMTTNRTKNLKTKKVFLYSVEREIQMRRMPKVDQLIQCYFSLYKVFEDTTLYGYDLMMLYYAAHISYIKGNYNRFYNFAVIFIKGSPDYEQLQNQESTIPISHIKSLREKIWNMGNNIVENKRKLRLLKIDYVKIHRNTRVVVNNKIKGIVETTKIKKIEKELQSGFCEILDIEN